MKRPPAAVRHLAWYPVVALIAVVWMLGFDRSVGGPPDDPWPWFYRDVTAAAAVIAVPGYLALALLLSARDRARAEAPDRDAPAALLAAAVATLPEQRQNWADAMTAELAQVEGRRKRWGFALGCAGTALFPPLGNRRVALAGAVVAALSVGAAWLVVGGVLPSLRVFSAAFVGLAGTGAVLALGRSGRLRNPALTPGVTAAGVAAVGACIAVTVHFLTRFPLGARHLAPLAAVSLAVLLSAYLALAFAPPSWLTAERLPQRIALGLTIVVAAGLFGASRLGVRGIDLFDSGILPSVFFFPMGALFVGGLVAAGVRRSFRAGATTALWTALLTSPTIYAIAVLESITWFEVNHALIYAADGIPIEAIGENIRNFAWGLILFPLWWLPFGVFGAALGSRVRRARAQI